ncbi:MAG: sigma-54-dependent Fis family transcriptional regulator [Proteobacteria bacterium]|nr:sigma-54-dependent Fis family transcriptional regulator [Pseudomonadota bacterium]
MTDLKTVLVADDEPSLRRVLGSIIQREGHRVVTASDGQAALTALRKGEVHTIITDLRMPQLDGMELLRRAIVEYPDIPVVILTAHGSVDSAVAAVKLGAFDYLEKPFEQQQIQQVLAKALRTNELRRREMRLGGAAATNGRFGLVGTSAPMRTVYNVIEKVADTPSTVLITGESGTGKELVAKAIHEQSARHDKALIKVNCAAIPDALIESELFGHERGAFTGAVSAKPGRFELAESGTLFLDEIGEIPLEMQVKLLRALQDGEFDRVGGIKTVKVDVRLVTATNRDLGKEVESGRFREDLFYRLNVVPIHLPPLRDRRADIPLLVDHILEKFRSRLGKDVRALDPDALAVLATHDWPGNIRELENLLERTILFCEHETIAAADLPAPLGGGTSERPALVTGDSSLKEIVRAETERVERQLILSALEETGGNVTHAAKRLKISRKSLQNKMKELSLRDPEGGGQKG